MTALPTTRKGPDSPEGMSRTWSPERPVDVYGTVATLRRGGGDPTWRQDGHGWWKGWQTPVGAATTLLTVDQAAGQVRLRAWGPGADVLLERSPNLLGERDDPTGFVAHHPFVASAVIRHHGWRVPRTGLLVESLVPAIIEQRVTGREAFTSYRRLVRRHGEPAPGPGADLGLMVAPSAEGWSRIPSWEWLSAGVDAGRADTVQRALPLAERLDRRPATLRDARAVGSALAGVRGVGVWTVAEVAQRVLGDADAVSFGDYHVARNVGWALLGAVIDDDQLAELLRPYAGHRYRVQRLVELTRVRVPRHGPRRSLPTHLPAR
ncbi:MAG TPA: DNA-3-methyladenine glycosylase 2 family protein [Dermatophilaceae bacterium]|nr:DNA-3-methyladenine glycosylase 2 family protein [Dermatophilaceae bacterium]